MNWSPVISINKTTSDFLSNYMGQSFVDILPTLKSRTAIAMGKAFRSNAPMIFEVPEISEAAVLPKGSKDDRKIISEE